MLVDKKSLVGLLVEIYSSVWSVA